MRYAAHSKMSLIFMGLAACVLVTSLAAIQKANAEFVFSEPVKVENVNTDEYGECDSSISADGLELYFRGSDSYKRTPKGYGNWDLYVAKRKTRFHKWETPVNLGGVVNGDDHVEGPSISSDGLELYFSSGRPGATGGTGDYDLWVTKRETKDSPWQTPANLGAVVNSISWDLFPCISSDNLELYLSSHRLGKIGGSDIWVTKRDTKNSLWQTPENVSEINHIFIDSHPNISFDGLVLYFISYRSGEGYGNREIYISRRNTINSPWQTPINLGPIVNSEYSESGPNISSDGFTLYFDRFLDNVIPGVVGYSASDIHQTSITPVVDFNKDGKVNMDDYSILYEKLGRSGSSVKAFDIYPPPIGDEKIDDRDLDVFFRFYLNSDRLISHWMLDESDGAVAYDNAGGFDGEVFGGVFDPNNGKDGGTLLLDGLDDYVEVPFVWNPEDGKFSAFAWVKGGELGQVIISQKNSHLLPSGRTWLGIDSLEGKLMTWLSTTGRAGGMLVSDSVVVNRDDWYHVGFVWDGLRRSLYVDGKEVGKDNNDTSEICHLTS